jgi:hypothetical protein
MYSDLGHALGSKVKHALQQDVITNMLNECTKSDSPQTKEIAVWAKDVSDNRIFASSESYYRLGDPKFEVRQLTLTITAHLVL